MHRFNAAELPHTDPAQPDQPHADFCHAQARDFTRLNTNIPHALIRETFSDLWHAIFLAQRLGHIAVTARNPHPSDERQAPTFTAAKGHPRNIVMPGTSTKLAITSVLMTHCYSSPHCSRPSSAPPRVSNLRHPHGYFPGPVYC